MDTFLAVFLGMGLSSMFFDNWSENFDIVSELPLEVAVMILRKLDPKSLLNAIRVCRRWYRIVKSDKVLRKTVRDELIRQREEKMKKHLFFSASARITVMPYAMGKESKRKFEVSVKTVSKPTKKRKISWEVSTTQAKRLR